MVMRRRPPTRMPATPWSHPGITWPLPSPNLKVEPRSHEASNCFPVFHETPTYCTSTTRPATASSPSPISMSSSSSWYDGGWSEGTSTWGFSFVAMPRTVAARCASRSARALEQGHALDVRGLREHVDRADAGERPPRLHELRGVRRERGRVAGDVDDPAWPGLDDPADHLLREPGARGIDDAHVRAPGALDEVAHGEADVAGVEARVGHLVAPRVVDRVGDGRLHDLHPDHLARPRGERQGDGADARVEVEDALVAAQRGELHRGAVQALGHLRVRLEEGVGRDRELELAEALVEPRGPGQERRLAALGALPEVGRLRPEQPVAFDGGGERVRVDASGRGDEPHLQLARAPPLADHEIAQEAAVRPPVPRFEALRIGPREHLPARRVAPLGGEQDVVDGDDLVEAAGRVEAAHQLPARARAERVLHLVAVAPLLDGGDHGLQREAVEAADAAQRVVHLLRLDLQLALVRDDLPRRTGVVRARRHAVRRGLDDLDGARLGVGALGLADDGADAIARHRAGHEDDVAVQARDAVPAVREGVDGELELVPAGGAARGGGRRGPPSRLSAGATSHSSSAFCACRRFSAWSQIRWRAP